MAPDSPRGSKLSSRLKEFARALFLAGDAAQALRAWIAAADPRCGLVVLLRASDRQPQCAFGLERGDWGSTLFPPVKSSFEEGTRTARGIGASRADAFEDAVYSSGFHELAYLPLAPAESGTLVVARSDPAFRAEELEEMAEDLDLLGRALVALQRRQKKPALRQGSPREVSELFGLTHALALAARPEAALEAGAGTLKTLLAPERGALVVSVSNGDAPLALSWPLGSGAAEALDRAARAGRFQQPVEKRVSSPRGGSASSFDPLDWLVLGKPGDPVSMALGWSGGRPEAARRVAQAVHASLALACDRFRVQKLHEDSRMGSALRDLPIGILLVARDARIRLANPRARELLDSLDSWPGSGEVLARLGAFELDEVRVREAAKRGDALEIHESQGGRTLVARFFVEAHGGVDARDGEGDVVIVLEDVTLERRQKQRLLQAEKLSALATVMHGIAHDVRQPLSTISGFAQMLHKRPLPVEELRWVGMIREEADRCDRLLKDINLVAKDEAPEMRPMDLGPLAKKVVQLAVPDLRKRDVEASLSIDPDTPAVRADSATMTRVMLNLVNNAIQALEGHPAPRTIEVRVATDELSREAVITVSDNGPGVPAEIRDRIFDPYVTTKEEGTGLGLSIVAQRLRAQGASIELDEDHAPGACFRIRMPAFVSASEADGHEEAHAPRAARRPVVLSEAPLAERRVLVAEDDEGFGCVLGEFLQAAGATVEVIRDGQDAFERAIASSPDVIVCDLNLPRLPGDALLARLRQSAPELVERVIFATGEGTSAADGPVGERLGRPCLSKPFDLQILVEHICGAADLPSESTSKSLAPRDGRGLTDH